MVRLAMIPMTPEVQAQVMQAIRDTRLPPRWRHGSWERVDLRWGELDFSLIDPAGVEIGIALPYQRYPTVEAVIARAQYLIRYATKHG